MAARRSLLEWWRDRQAYRRWRNGPARRPTQKEIDELRARLRELKREDGR